MLLLLVEFSISVAAAKDTVKTNAKLKSNNDIVRRLIDELFIACCLIVFTPFYNSKVRS